MEAWFMNGTGELVSAPGEGGLVYENLRWFLRGDRVGVMVILLCLLWVEGNDEVEFGEGVLGGGALRGWKRC